MTGELPARADVAVVGAGAIGASVALWLARRGASVVVVERGYGWAAECSRGNGGWICPSHAGPFARRRDVLDALRWLTRADSPFAIRPDLRLVPWLMRLARASGDGAVARVTDEVRQLARESLTLHAELAAQGLDTGFHQRGLLDVYRTAAGWDAARRAAERHREAGLPAEEVDASDARAMEPMLADAIVGGIHFPDDAHCDPLRYVQAVGGAAIEAGARFVEATTVVEIAQRGGGPRLVTSRGALDAEAVVVAAGVATARLAGDRRDPLPVVAGQGYSLDLRVAGAPAPRRPLMLSEDRVAVTPLDDVVRLAGTMEIGGRRGAIDYRRAAGIEAAARDLLPPLATASVGQVWSGQRPCTPDGRPIVRWSAARRGVAIATGHAMLGLTLAPVTGQRVAELLDGGQRLSR